MSIISLKLDSTVVERQEDFSVTGRAVRIAPIDKKQLPNANRVIATYDLRVGKKYRDHRAGDGKDLKSNGRIKLPPGATFVIETEEWVHFPQGMFGYLIPKVGLLQNGISNTLSKVDPGYHGHLIVTVFNLGKKSVFLDPGQAFCALAIHGVEGAPDLYNNDGKQISTRSAAGTWNSFWDWADRNSGRLAIFLLAVALVDNTGWIIGALKALKKLFER